LYFSTVAFRIEKGMFFILDFLVHHIQILSKVDFGGRHIPAAKCIALKHAKL